MFNEKQKQGPKDAVYWYEQYQPQNVETLTENVSADVVVVGGGAAGLSAVLRLVDAGKNVVVLESGVCGGGASGKSSGFITPDSELEFSDLVQYFGEHEALQLWAFAESGMERMRAVISKYQLECEYSTQDSLFVAKNKAGIRLVQDEYRVQTKAGLEAQYYSQDTVPEVLGSRGYFAAMRTKGTYGINAFLYCQKLKEYLQSRGVKVFEYTAVAQIVPEGVVCQAGVVRANAVIVCTDRFLPDLGIASREVYHAQTFLGLTNVLSLAERQALFPSGSLMVWDTDLIYQYFRLTPEGRLLIGSADLTYTYWPSEVHGSGRMARKIEQYLARYFPNLSCRLEYLWPGLLGVTKDFVPVAGQSQALPNVYYCGAAAGLPWATALGQYVAEKFVAERDELDIFFDPARKFAIATNVQRVIGKPLGFALSHGLSKYKKFF